MTPSKSIKAAVFRILILGIVYREESYGYQLIEKIKEISEGTLIMKEGTLYPLLKSLKRENLLRSSWKKSMQGKSRKYYSITESGKAEYKRLRNEWSALTTMMQTIDA